MLYEHPPSLPCMTCEFTRSKCVVHDNPISFMIFNTLHLSCWSYFQQMFFFLFMSKEKHTRFNVMLITKTNTAPVKHTHTCAAFIHRKHSDFLNAGIRDGSKCRSRAVRRLAVCFRMIRTSKVLNKNTTFTHAWTHVHILYTHAAYHSRRCVSVCLTADR